MYQILVEIHDSLSDKSENAGGPNKIGVAEMVWLMGIEEHLDNIHENEIPALPNAG